MEEEKEEPQKEFWTELFQYLVDQKIPELEEVREKIATVEKRTNISVHDYLGFGALHTPLKTYTDSYGKYYGELNADGEAHGRGIGISNDGHIIIGYFVENDWYSTGNYIVISSDGDFLVGKFYLKDGMRSFRSTRYNTDGSEE